MLLHTGARTASLLSVAFAVAVGLIADPVLAQALTGTATYRERMALPPGAVFEATIEDVSRADAPSSVLASTRITSSSNPPIAFTITYDAGKVLPDRRYVVRARILVADQLMFTTDTATPVITHGNPTRVSLMLRRVGGTQAGPGPGAPGIVKSVLEGTSWRAIELAGKPVPPPKEKRDATLVFHTGDRVSGFDGCNSLTGGYTLTDNGGITFGQAAATQKACLDSPETERGFRAALKSASRWRIDGSRLELYDAAGARVAVFASGSQPSQPVANVLQGTRWQLVVFQGSDGTKLTPDDRGKYTIEFDAGGRLNARVDCNRGRGTWKSNGPQLEFGPLALTRAACPPGSLHDRIVKQWTYIRSYVMKDGHLFLALMADGGIYEFEPLAAAAPRTAAPQTAAPQTAKPQTPKPQTPPRP